MNSLTELSSIEVLDSVIAKLISERAELVRQSNEHRTNSDIIPEEDAAIELTFASTKMHTAAGYGLSLLVLQRTRDLLLQTFPPAQK